MNNFDWEFYIFLYGDLNNITNEEDAINHYVNHGIKEKRICDKLLYDYFDNEFYISNYPDLSHLKTKKDAFVHYITYGINEKRIFSKYYHNFDWEFYIFLYDDLKDIKTKQDAYKHYITVGVNENRIPNYKELNSIDFDWKFYTSFYDDLKNINNKEDALKHYILKGKNENRIPNYKELSSIDLDWEFYISLYDELKENNIKKYDIVKHYINNEDKNKIYKLFDYEYYYNLYPDLKKDNINTLKETYKHWINYGKNENRIINNYTDFNWKFYKFYYNLTNINSKIEALFYYIEHKKILKNVIINEIMFNDFIIFDYKKYIEYYNLINITNKNDAFDHWYLNGKMEGKIFFIKPEFSSNQNLNKDIGIAISVYSDEKTPKERILCSKLCLNSIIKICRNINIIIVIDYNILEEHLIFIKILIKNHSNIKLYKNNCNYGIAKTKNIGIKLLEEYNFKYFALLDDDIEIIKNFSKYVIEIFEETNIPLIANYNKLLSYEKEGYFIKTENYWGNILIINKEYLKKWGYFYIFDYKWGEEHVELTKRYLSESEYNNTAIYLTEYIKNEQIINGNNTINLHSIDIDFKKADENKEMMFELLKNKKYINFIFNKNDITLYD